MPIAFKEWAVTVRALAEGEQLLTLRKGGIREPDKHFQLEHDRFFLYPTFDHQRTDLVRGAREALPGSLGALADVAPELSVTAFAGDAAAQRRLAPVERSALQRFPLGLKKILHEQAGTSTALGRGTAELLERSA